MNATNPIFSTNFGQVAQWLEHPADIRKVVSSSLTLTTNFLPPWCKWITRLTFTQETRWKRLLQVRCLSGVPISLSFCRLTWYGTCFGSMNNAGSNPVRKTNFYGRFIYRFDYAMLIPWSGRFNSFIAYQFFQCVVIVW